MRRIIFVVCLLCMTVDAIAEVTVGIFPRRAAASTLKLYTPLVKALSIEMGEPFKLVVVKDFKRFWEAVVNQEYDLVHYNQYHYIRSHKEQGYRVLVANKEHGSGKIAGMLAVRKDSNINSIEDLRGKSIIFSGGRKAMVAYIAPTAMLKRAGLQEGKDYKVRFTKNSPSALVGVHNRFIHAAGTGNIALEVKAVTQTIDVSKLKVLAEGEKFVHLPWAASKNLSRKKQERIRKFMVDLSNTVEGRKILKAARVDGFYAVRDGDFQRVRKITDYVLGEKF